MRATIVSIAATYCHAVAEGTQDRIFIHQQEANFSIGGVLIGDVVDVPVVEETSRGLRGLNATWAERPIINYVEPEDFAGVVVHIDSIRKFAFVRPADKFVAGVYKRSPFDVMAHISAAADYNGESLTFDRLARGAKVRGVVRDTSRGRRLEVFEEIA